MSKIIACIDGSVYADTICFLSAFIHKNSDLPVSLLHVVRPHSEVVSNIDVSGQIGLGAKSSLLEELSRIDEAHGKLEQQKGKLMLEHAKEELTKLGIKSPEIMHCRGALVEILKDVEDDAALIVMGKRGEHHQDAVGHLGSNLERVARSVKTPILVANRKVNEIKKLLIAYDGSSSAKMAVQYILDNPKFKKLECHILTVGEDILEAGQEKQLEDSFAEAGYSVTISVRKGKQVEPLVAEYVAEYDINLLVIGAYGHSKIRSLILGSTTTALISKSTIPVLLFR